MQDTRCCGTGTCLIDASGRCWCGQQWEGEQMCRPNHPPTAADQQTPVDDAPKADNIEGQRA